MKGRNGKILILMLVVLVYGFGWYQLSWSKKVSADEDVALIDGQRADVEAQIAAARAAQANIENLRNIIAVGRTAMPVDNVQADFIRLMSDLTEQDSSVNWTAGTPETVLDSQAETYLLSVTADGNWERMLELLGVLKDSDRLTVLTEVALDGEGLGEASFSVASFGWVQGYSLDPTTGRRLPAEEQPVRPNFGPPETPEEDAAPAASGNGEG